MINKVEAKKLLKDKKLWFASFLIAWAAALQGHMMWLQRQDSFKQKFGIVNEDNTIKFLENGLWISRALELAQFWSSVRFLGLKKKRDLLEAKYAREDPRSK
ncbi:hypothetical protein SADUNF_Sadunf08G0039600 [Salix dunnii]|uniref:Uncharacterized protein n=1 Tax=Salix dunnii TaxID=1413687 RepID=A0A835MU55_9ROSI|nr:hypothetical protein SADUNF_Sadunf08G0039600 [Salix dunnii]